MVMTRKEWCPGPGRFPIHYHPHCLLFPDQEVEPYEEEEFRQRKGPQPFVPDRRWPLKDHGDR